MRFKKRVDGVLCYVKLVSTDTYNIINISMLNKSLITNFRLFINDSLD